VAAWVFGQGGLFVFPACLNAGDYAPVALTLLVGVIVLPFAGVWVIRWEHARWFQTPTQQFGARTVR